MSQIPPVDLLRQLDPEMVIHVPMKVREILAGMDTPAKPALRATLSVADIAADRRKSPGTVRGWLAGGLIPEAYRPNGRDWEVPREAYDRFLQRLQAGEVQIGRPVRKSEAKPAAPTTTRRPRLSDWRSVAADDQPRRSRKAG